MSTELQLKGDSRRRQLQRSQHYAEQYGLELATADQLEDIGISAFKGRNVTQGALGRFVQAVKAGTVEQGSYLLVESLDRISRQPVVHSLSLFLEIVNAGIIVVTLADGKVFKGAQTDFADLIISLTILARAHEESAIKADRLSAAWGNKRKKAAMGQPMTKWAPAWLRLTDDRTSFEVLSDRAAVVRRIFEDAASGIGMYTITVRLNASNIPTFTDSNGWHQSYVSKILSNRAVLGEFQPGIRKDGVRVAEGDPIRDYYPAIIPEDLFFRAQHGKAQRRQVSAGRKGKAFTNIFGRLATCSYCKSRIAFENKGLGPKGGAYLICDNARRKLGCPALRWRYKDFEATFLAFVEELDLESIINASEDSAKRSQLEADISALKGEIIASSKLMEQTYALLNDGGPTKFLAQKLTDLENKIDETVLLLRQKEEERETFEARESRFYTSREEINALVAQLQSDPDADIYKLRAQIASRLNVLVESLTIASAGDAPRLKKNIETLKQLGDGSIDDVIDFMSDRAEEPEQARRYFAVAFRDASLRVVYPKVGNPLDFEMQIEADKENSYSIRH